MELYFISSRAEPLRGFAAPLRSLRSLRPRVLCGKWVLASLGCLRASQYVPALACHLSVSLQSFALFRSSLPVVLSSSVFALHFTRSLPFVRSSFASSPPPISTLRLRYACTSVGLSARLLFFSGGFCPFSTGLGTASPVIFICPYYAVRLAGAPRLLPLRSCGYSLSSCLLRRSRPTASLPNRITAAATGKK